VAIPILRNILPRKIDGEGIVGLAPSAASFAAGSNLLLGYVNGLASNLGISYRPGQEGVFLSSLQRGGLAADGVQVLARLLNGKGVKLHEYRSVVSDLEARAKETLLGRVAAAGAYLESVHEQAMRALDDRGLTTAFVQHFFLENLVFLQCGYKSPGGIADVSCEFRHFAENEGDPGLFCLAHRYIMASILVGEERARLESLPSGRL
jgi:hypothetical protein